MEFALLLTGTANAADPAASPLGGMGYSYLISLVLMVVSDLRGKSRRRHRICFRAWK